MSSLNNGFTIIIVKVIYLLVWSLLNFALSLLSFPDFIHCFSSKVQKTGTNTFFGLNIINGPSCWWNKWLKKLNVSQ